VSWATGVFGKEKVLGESWECSGRRESREGKLGTGVDFHQTRAGWRGHVVSDLVSDLDARHGSKSHLSSAANGFDSRDFMISANFLQKKIWWDKEDR
jgi:hypothetical protein